MTQIVDSNVLPLALAKSSRDEVIDRIYRLRSRINKLEPVRLKLRSLFGLVNPLMERTTRQLQELTPPGTDSAGSTHSPLLAYEADLNSSVKCKRFLETLSEIEAEYSQNGLSAQTVRQLRNLDDDLELLIQSYKTFFCDVLAYVQDAEDLVGIMVSKMRHPSKLETARLKLQNIREQSKLLDPDELRKHETDLLDSQVEAVIVAAFKIQLDLLEVRRICEDDQFIQKRVNRLFYSGCLVVIMVSLALSMLGNVLTLDLSKRTALLDAPWCVLVWTLIGCIAAMLRRFNRHPVYLAEDLLKFLLGRPAQAIVIGVVFWQIYKSGLLPIQVKPEIELPVVLLLSFLIGFSDRFTEYLLGTLVDKYGGNGKPASATNKNQ